MDRSNGYDEIAEQYVAARNPGIGAAIVREWTEALPAGARVLDVGCGHGEPIGRILTERECQLFAVDASERLLEEFRKRFPAAMTEHAAVQEAEFFAQKFDGIVAWGLLFLLAAEEQAVVLGKMAKALQPNGKLLFTAPREALRWKDAMTQSESISLGRKAYRRILQAEGLRFYPEQRDEGGNHYYLAAKACGKSL